jgi:hypothetical protein
MRPTDPDYIKPNAAEMTRRLNIVEELILKGLNSFDIWRYLAEAENLDISKRTTERYIQKVNKKWDKAKEPLREREIKKALKRYNMFLNECLLNHDPRGAAKVQDSICKLLGLNAPDKMDIKAKVEIPALNFSKLSTEKLKILKALLEEAKPDKKEDL